MEIVEATCDTKQMGDVPKMPSFQTLLINWYRSIGIVRGVFQTGRLLSLWSDYRLLARV